MGAPVKEITRRLPVKALPDSSGWWFEKGEAEPALVWKLEAGLKIAYKDGYEVYVSEAPTSEWIKLDSLTIFGEE